MNNNDKIENTNKSNINFENELNDLINYGKWELSLISSLKLEKTYKKNLLLIDKEWLFNWKKISGYNLIKNQIFKYLEYEQKNINDKINCDLEAKKLNELWLDIKSRNNINIANTEKIPALCNKKYLMKVNNKTLINGKENFDIISNDIFDMFKQYLNKTQIIKVTGLFCKKKLLLPFNYNDKNMNYIFINMLFILNNKNELGEIFFEFPNLKLNIIEKIRKKLPNKNNNEYIKEFSEQQNKDFIFIDEDSIEYTYKALFKSKNNILKGINSNKIEKKNIENKNIKYSLNEINNKQEKIGDDLNMNNIKDLSNFDINKLTMEQIEQKIKQIEEETLKQNEEENDLKEQENLLIKEYGLINNEYDEEYKKYQEQIEEIDNKLNISLKEIKHCKEKENNLNEEYKKAKSDYNNKQNEINKKIEELNDKEALIRSKMDEITQRENELNNKEKDLDKKEQELNMEENKNNKKRKQLKDIEEEINEKIEILKKEEDLENERINKELEDEMKELENQINSSNINKKKSKEMPVVDEADEENNNSFNNYNNTDKNSIKADYYKKTKSQQLNYPFLKLNKLNSQNIIIPNNSKSNKQIGIYNSLNSNSNSNPEDNNINTNNINTPNNDIKSLSGKKLLISQKSEESKGSKEIKEKIIIDKNTISLGLEKMNPVNLNSIIQCFAHLKDIIEGFLNLEKNNFFEKNKESLLSQEFLNIIKNLFSQENSDVYSLNDFWNSMIKKDEKKNIIKNKSPLYIDSKNLINFLIEELHQELNTKRINIKKSNSNKNFESEEEKEALTKCLEDFTKNNNSLISKNFYGLLKQKKICQGCKTEKYSFKFYTFLTFDLSQVKQFLSNKKSSIKLSDCFDFYNKPEYLVGDSGLFCSKCKSRNNYTVLNSIYSTHPIIPIIFERDDDSKLDKEKIDFPEELDLGKYIEYKSSSKKFFLCGVVSNFGYSNNFGKFEAFCRMEQNAKWFNYNDEQVTESNWDDIHKKGIQHVLFYHKE